MSNPIGLIRGYTDTQWGDNGPIIRYTGTYIIYIYSVYYRISRTRAEVEEVDAGFRAIIPSAFRVRTRMIL